MTNVGQEPHRLTLSPKDKCDSGARGLLEWLGAGCGGSGFFFL